MIELKNQRAAYGEALVKLGREYSRIVVLEADLSKSTMGTQFENAYPGRFYEMGIAEANMAGVAAGLALTDRVPFMASFAVFATGRCYDQIRNSICISKLNVKICGSSAGLSDFGDGATHQSVEDIAIMRALPNMQVFVPADAVQVGHIMHYMAENEGPMYLRINRLDLPVYTKEDEAFVPGRVYTLREGSDAAVFACGVMVSKAIEAAELLHGVGVTLKVVNVPSIKPLCAESVRDICGSVKGVVTAEEGSTIGGLGSAIAEIVTSKMEKRIQMVGIKDKFGISAENYDVLMQEYRLTSSEIVQAVKNVLNL